MISDNTYEFIRNLFNDKLNNRKLIKVKELKTKLTEEYINQLYNEFSCIPELNILTDCFDRIKNGIRLILLGYKDVKTCKICNSRLSLEYTIDNRIYCSPTCRKKDYKCWTSKMKETCLNKYGVVSNFCTQEFLDKTKETCLEKYGVDHISKAKITKEHIKQTNLERYGHECSMHGINEEKTRMACLEKYRKYLF
jgi:hypothetical protein